MSVPCVSLAMIVKDEQDNLDQCLKSVSKHVDEIVIVDTGSVDKTKDVARSYGAKVFDFNHLNHPEAFFVDDEATCKAFEAPPPFSGEIAFADFGAARNESFKHATGDLVLWLDADDVLEGAENLRGVAADIWTRGLDFGFLPYDYAKDHLGRTFYRQWRERIVRRGAAGWVNPVHEVLMPNRPVSSSKYDQVTVSHRRKADRKSTPNRNYKILLRHYHAEKRAGRPMDPRTLFYLGQEARFVDAPRAAGFYREYLQKSGWNEERAAAHSALGQLLEFGMLGMSPEEAYAQANAEYAASAIEMPDNPDGLFGLARIAYLRGRWNDCISYSERGLKIGNTESMLGANPMDRLYRPHVYYNHALSKTGRIEEAIASCKAALAVCPDDPGIPGGAPGMLKHNLAVYEKEVAARKPPAPQPSEQGMVQFDKSEDLNAPPVSNIPKDALVIWALQLWKQNVAANDGGRALSLIDALPAVIGTDPVIARMRETTIAKFPGAKSATDDARDALLMANQGAEITKRALRTWSAEGFCGSLPPRLFNLGDYKNADVSRGGMSVVIYTGGCFEEWNPLSPNERGLGGSETACIEVAKHLVALGHQVTVYSECGTGGVFDGVTYRNHRQFAGCNADVFISSRAPWAVEHFGAVNARLKLLWVHDIHCGPNSADMERWLYKFDRILCLSEWHKGFFAGCYPTLHPERIIVTRNGIDPERFDSKRHSDWLNKTNSLVFSSSPNRGLDMLLHNFQFIREQVPDAELHVAYGFQTWEAMTVGNPAEQAEIQRYKDAINEGVKRGGVHFHGRVNQRQLAELFMRAKVWSMLSMFTETSCISAMEAQAAGCVPVCSPRAALPETVKHGIFIKDGADCGQKWLDATVRCLKDEDYRRPIAEAGRKYALENLSWASLAKDWAAMFSRLIGEVAVNPVAMWKSA